MRVTLLILLSLFSISCEKEGSKPQESDGQKQADVNWKEVVVINDQSVLNYAGDSLIGPEMDYRARFGSQYPRLLQLNDDSWLAAYTVSTNYGYMVEEDGGFRLEIARSVDDGRNWEKISEIKEEGRDLDNAQMIQLSDGSILLTSRSVRWQESYQLPVFKSHDNGRSWSKISTIDSNEGVPGELGNPDKGVYEPHMLSLDDGRIAVVYANEKHVTGPEPYSQIISEKISNDLGESWADEIWAVYEEGDYEARPGMPVWSKMENGKFILVYEICGPQGCNIYSKISEDGISWPDGHGSPIPNQSGAPYVLSMDDGTLIVTSNKGTISTSTDFGSSWHQTQRAWHHEKSFEEDWTQTIWSSLYQTGPDEVAIVTSVQRLQGGHSIRIRFGDIN